MYESKDVSSTGGFHRREVLWNVLTPGDPYDIKRSMIPTIPGSNRQFMGEHLQVVCLLQTAEIERLSEFLDEYKLRYRELDRRELDRHSYQVQIKELMGQTEGEQSLRNELLRYKQQSRTMEIEGQSYDRSQYDSVVRQVESLMGENRGLRAANESLMGLKIANDALMGQLQSAGAKLEALEKAKNREIEALRGRQTSSDQINNLRAYYENQLRRIEFEVKKLKEINQAKSKDIGRIQELSEKYLREKSMLQSQMGRVHEYENKFMFLGNEIERLNFTVVEMARRAEDGEGRRRELQQKCNKLQEERAHWKASQQEISKPRDRNGAADLESEVKRLNGQLAGSAQQLSHVREEAGRLEYQLSRLRIVERENGELKHQTEEYLRRLAECDHRILMMSSEIQFRQAQMQKWKVQTERPAQPEQQSLIKYEKEWASKYEKEWAIKYEKEWAIKYEKSISDKAANNSNQRVTTLLKEKQSMLKEIEGITRERQEMRLKMSREIMEANRRMMENEAKLINFRPEMDARFIALSHQNEGNLIKLRSISGEMQFMRSEKGDLLRKLAMCEQSLMGVSRENEFYRGKLSELQQRFALADGIKKQEEAQDNARKGELDRVSQLLRRRNEEYAGLVQDSNKRVAILEQRCGSISMELERILGENSSLRNGKVAEEELRRRVAEMGLEINRMQEGSRRASQIEAKAASLEVRVRQYEQRIRQYEQKIGSSEQKMRQFQQRGNEQWGRKLGQVSRRCEELGGECDRMDHLLRAKTEECGRLEGQLQRGRDSLRRKNEECALISDSNARLLRQIETLRKQTHEAELAFSEKVESELKSRVRAVESVVGDRRAEWEREEKSKIAAYESQLLALTRDLERKTQEMSRYEVSTRQSVHEMELNVRQLRTELNQTVQNYEIRLKQCDLENDELREKYNSLVEDSNKRLAAHQERHMNIEAELSRLKGGKGTELDSIRVAYSAVMRQNEEAKRHLVDYEGSVKKLSEQFNKFQGMMNAHRAERAGLLEKNRMLSLEIVRLQGENRELDEQTKDARMKYSNEMSLQKQVQEQLALMVVLFAEIQTLRKRVKDKENEVAEVRRSSLASFQI